MMTMNERWIIPEWPAPSNVRSIQTTRHGGVSSGAYASMNVAMHVNDAAQSVAQNRQYLRQILPNEPLWLNQVHGVDVLDATHAKPNMQADAAYTRHKQVVCVSMTADCLPVLFCDQSGTVVAAAHAGWRGLCAGVLEKTVSAMQVQTNSVMAWFGQQWTELEEEAHYQQGREPFVFNEIQHKVDHLVGTQTQTRLDIKTVS